MRLRNFRPGSIKVRRGSSGSRMPGGTGGKLGCGGIAILLIGALVFGLSPDQMLGTMDAVQQQQGAPSRQAGPAGAPGETAMQICDDNAYAMESCNALASLDETWAPLFAQAGIAFEQPTLYFYRGGTRSGCGAAASSMGPFYCPGDQGIYIDTSFYDTLGRQMGAQGDFARYYVMAHEYGHHVQYLTGLTREVRRVQQANPQLANRLQVAMELQADCYAGVWAGRNRDLIEPGDLEEGLRAASAIGDDTLMRGAGQAVNPESFTHGSSQQRMIWLRTGLETGNDEACDTFAELQL